MNEVSQSEVPAAMPAAATAEDAARASTGEREAWRSEELLGERTEVLILHGNEIYRLRRTRQGKLILYK